MLLYPPTCIHPHIHAYWHMHTSKIHIDSSNINIQWYLWVPICIKVYIWHSSWWSHHVTGLHREASKPLVAALPWGRTCGIQKRKWKQRQENHRLGGGLIGWSQVVIWWLGWLGGHVELHDHNIDAIAVQKFSVLSTYAKQGEVHKHPRSYAVYLLGYVLYGSKLNCNTALDIPSVAVN